MMIITINNDESDDKMMMEIMINETDSTDKTTMTITIANDDGKDRLMITETIEWWWRKRLNEITIKSSEIRGSIWGIIIRIPVIGINRIGGTEGEVGTDDNA